MGKDDRLPEGFHDFVTLLDESVPDRLQHARALYALNRLCHNGRELRRGFNANTANTVLVAVCQHSLRRLSPDPLSFGAGKTERFRRTDLKEFAKRTEQLISYVRKLKRTHLVVYLQATGVIPADDVLSAPYLHHEGETAHIVQSLKGLLGLPMDAPLDDAYVGRLARLLETVIALPRLLTQYTAAFNPLGDYLLSFLCQYVHQTTGRWNDALLANILSPFRVPHTESTEALRVWRNRTLHPRVTRKTPKNT